MQIELPEEPVDGMEVTWYEANLEEEGAAVRKWRARYCVDTPFEEINGRAHPLLANYKAMWIIWSPAVLASGDAPIRGCRWSMLRQYFAERPLFFSTEEGAKQSMKQQLRASVEKKKAALAEEEEQLLILETADGNSAQA